MDCCRLAFSCTVLHFNWTADILLHTINKGFGWILNHIVSFFIATLLHLLHHNRRFQYEIHILQNCFPSLIALYCKCDNAGLNQWYLPFWTAGRKRYYADNLSQWSTKNWHEITKRDYVERNCKQLVLEAHAVLWGRTSLLRANGVNRSLTAKAWHLERIFHLNLKTFTQFIRVPITSV